MSPDLGFPLFLGLTVVLLIAVVATGRAAKLRMHLPLVGLALASLGVTIYFAEQLGDFYDLESAGVITHVHLTVAKVTTALYLFPLVTGVLTLRNRRYKQWHGWAAGVTLTMTVVTAVTGSMMIWLADRLPV